MTTESTDRELTRHLTRTLGLPPQLAERAIAEMLAYFDETTEQFVRRRHLELQHQGLTNREAFAHIREELRTRRFTAVALSERQIRRLVYG